MKVRYIVDDDCFDVNGNYKYPYLTDGREYEAESRDMNDDTEWFYMVFDEDPNADGAKPYSFELFEPISYVCPCCGELTLDGISEYETCYVCEWVDDPAQSKDPDNCVGENTLSLNQHRARWVDEKKRGVDTIDDYHRAKHYSRFNRTALQTDKVCGCYYCKQIFSPSEITEWCCETPHGKGVTALCPHCGIDSVISESSGYPITLKFLENMNKYAFTQIECYKTEES